MPNKGKKHSGGGKGSKEHGDKKSTGASKPGDKKVPGAAEKKTGGSGVSEPAGAQASGSSKTPTSQGKTMKPADTKGKVPPKVEPAKVLPKEEPVKVPPKEEPVKVPPKEEPGKSTQPTKVEPAKSTQATKVEPDKSTQATKVEPAKSTQQTKPKGTSTVPSATPAIKLISGKQPTKQDSRAAHGKQKTDPKASSGAAGKVAGAVATAGTVAAATAVASSKPKDEASNKKNVKEEKKVNVDDISAATTPAKTEMDDALDELIGTLGGPENVPESPKFTGPEVVDTTAVAEYLEELGKRETTIPPEYRHLLDGKGEKPALLPKPKEAKKSMSDDDLAEALSSGYESSQAPPEEKKPKLEEKKEVKAISTAAVSTHPSIQRDVKPTAAEASQPQALSDEALDELLGTLEAPPEDIPESPVYTGPEVTEDITSTYLEELGKRESSIPPKYRHLLDGKDNGKPIPPSAPVEQPQPMSDSELADQFAKDFECSVSPVAATTTAVKPKDRAQDTRPKPEVVASSASTVQAGTAPPSAGMEDALDELMGTLEGPHTTVPESPVYTGPEVTETSTAMYIEELGKRESTIPPAYRHLLDGKDDGTAAPPPPEEKPMSEADLVDEFSLDFASSEFPCAPQALPGNDSCKEKKTDKEVVVSSSAAAIKAAPVPSDSCKEKKMDKEVVVSSSAAAIKAAPVPSKAPAPKPDPHDALARALGVREEDPKDKKPVVDKVKEGTGKDKKEKLGEDERTIHPDYRLEEVKDKYGKPILPKPEERAQMMSEDDLLDALTEGFVTSPTIPPKTAPLQSTAKGAQKASGSGEVVVCSKASAVQSGAPQPPDSDVQIPDDALDLLSGSLGTRQVDPDENKPVVDVVKERAKEEHIDRLGDRDSDIPPEYRHLLDGKDGGKPAKPVPKEEKPKKPESDDAAIDALSSGLASCDTSSSGKTQQAPKDKSEKSSSSTPILPSSGKALDPAKSTNQTSSAKSSTPKASKS
ncbi:calpastatin [Rhinophrynus dorsalis]